MQSTDVKCNRPIHGILSKINELICGDILTSYDLATTHQLTVIVTTDKKKSLSRSQADFQD